MKSSNNINILIVDDSPVALFDFKFKLKESFDKDCIFVMDNIPDAKDVLEKQNINVAIIDLMMPEENGADLISEMKLHDRWMHIPVIIVTGTGSNSVLEYGFSQHVYAYLHKPVDEKELIRLIKECTMESNQTKIKST